MKALLSFLLLFALPLWPLQDRAAEQANVRVCRVATDREYRPSALADTAGTPTGLTSALSQSDAANAGVRGEHSAAAPSWLERNRGLVFACGGALGLMLMLVLAWNRSLRTMARRKVRELRESEQRLRFALGAGRMLAWRWNIPADALTWGEHPAWLLGPEPAGGYPDFRELVHAEDRTAVLQAGRLALAQQTSFRAEFRVVRTDGAVRWIEARGMPSTGGKAGNVGFMDGVSQDITERKDTEAKFQRLSNLYATLSQCNQAIVRSNSAEELFPQICRDAVQFGGLKMAWIGLVEQTGLRIKPMASCGEGIEFLQQAEISADAASSSGRGPTGTAIRENRPVWCQDYLHDPMTATWHEQGERYGWRASAALPLHRNNAVVGAFSLYAGEAGAFDGAARELLVEMAMDISFALDGFEREAQRRQAHEALSESEARFRSLSEMSSDFYWETDSEHRFTQRSAGSGDAALSVLAHGSPIGQRRWDLPYLSPDEATWQAHRTVLDAHQAFRDFEFSRLGVDGGELHYSISGDPVFDAAGAFRGYRGVGTNISRRKREERLLRLEHAVARSLAEASDESSALKTVMRSICETNNWGRGSYWRIDQAAGLMRFGDFWSLPGAEFERYTQGSRAVTFAPGVGIVGRVWQSGEPLWIADFYNDPRVVQKTLAREAGMRSVFAFPVVAGGHTVGVLAFFSRVAREPDARLLAATRMIGSEIGQFLQRMQAEERIRKLNAELEARVASRTQQLEIANRELEAFSYSVSHDLRAPLRAIHGFSSLVEKQYAGQIDEQGRDMLRRVSAGAAKMGNLIDDLLKLSRISRQAMRSEPIDLSELAWESAGELQAEVPERKVEWVIAPQVTAIGDPGLLRVALQNLLGNAWKYSSKRELARIEFGVAEQDGRPAYFVRDNGAGFDMADARKLFGAFQRLHSAAEFPGSGIGLATVARVIHRHDGEIWAEGRVGEGASFYFSLGSKPARPGGRDQN